MKGFFMYKSYNYSYKMWSKSVQKFVYTGFCIAFYFNQNKVKSWVPYSLFDASF